MFTNLENALLNLVEILPLEVFVFVASIIEEIIVPIPSPTIMLLAGSIASLEGRVCISLISLAVIGALGKTIGSVVVYVIADKAEDFVMNRFGSYFGVTHDDVERLGQKLGTGFKEYASLIFLRALPFMPSVVVSVGSGVLKIRLHVFIISSFLGTIIRDGFYLYVGYAGFALFAHLIEQSTYVETIIEYALLVLAGIIVGYLLWRKRNA